VADAKRGFREAMDDDLNIPLALSRIFEFMKEINKLMEEGKVGKKDAELVRKTMEGFDKVLGVMKKKEGVSAEMVKRILDMLVDLHEDLKAKDRESAEKMDSLLSKLRGKEYDPENFGKLISAVIEIRDALRKKKEYDLSDRIRAELRDIGVILEDKEDGVRWRIVPD